jgi:hypothetical protein
MRVVRGTFMMSKSVSGSVPDSFAKKVLSNNEDENLKARSDVLFIRLQKSFDFKTFRSR